MALLGWEKETRKKGLYVDGHDRPDVLQYKNEVYLPADAEHSKWMFEFEDDQVRAPAALGGQLVDELSHPWFPRTSTQRQTTDISALAQPPGYLQYRSRTHCVVEAANVQAMPTIKWTVPQLKDFAKHNLVAGYHSRMKRDELLKLLSVPPEEDKVDPGQYIPLPPEEKRNWHYKIKILHDESIIRSKDAGSRVWNEVGQNHVLNPKSEGQGVMASAFCSPHFGWLKYTDDAWVQAILQNPSWAADPDVHRNAYEMFLYGKQRQGYWTSAHLIKQLDRAISIFNVSYPGARGVWIFDWSSNHHCFASDALQATQMNVRPGGKQPKMRDGWYLDKSGNRIVQPMVDSNGEPKGLKIVLEERGLWKAGMIQEEMVDLLSSQPDFAQQKSMVEEWCERRGHDALFLPKFHPELSMIELCWGSWKRILRQHCDGTFETLKRNVHRAMDAIGTEEMRRMESHCQTYHRAYRASESGVTAQQNFKQYRSHRRIPANLDVQLTNSAGSSSSSTK